ncbi:MAG TPA: formyltetrahydrofolate deformylase [Verrucomicrobiae bacterium]|jgi:formyltetrahydrofolate deformylase|nr:formyltetrahydrofolate deformylase [Verrucomicrobiae bacterium]
MKQFATITVIGRDKSGVIARVTGFLFEQGANIEGLEEQVTRGQFSMTIQASWLAKKWDEPRLRDGLQKLAASLRMEIGLSFVEAHRRQRFALLVTREPHAMQAILAECRAGTLKAEPAVVISNRSDLEPLARRHGLPFERVGWEHRNEAEVAVLKLLEKHAVDFVVLARFMKILSPNFVWRYKNKVINIHPSLLPSFPGPQAYRQAYERGVKIVGVTAHFVTMHLDEGPIIAQGSFALRPSLTLPEIVAEGQKLESKVLVKAIKLYLRKRLDVFWGVVKET